jgi:DNA-binding transcriptional regulator LsrR (DeoR family)
MPASFQVHWIARQIAEAFGGTWRHLYVSAIVRSDALAAQLLTCPDVREVTGEWRRLTTALVGIGHVNFQSEIGPLFAQYWSADDRRRLRAQAAVGDICLRFLDRDGRPVPRGMGGVTSID